MVNGTLLVLSSSPGSRVMNAMPGEEVKMEIKVAEGALGRKFYGAIMQDTCG